MKDPHISIARATKEWAIFDGYTLLGAFVKYEVEADALALAKATVKLSTDKEPVVVYPGVKSMQMSSRLSIVGKARMRPKPTTIKADPFVHDNE